MSILKTFLSWRNINKTVSLMAVRCSREASTGQKLVDVKTNSQTGISVVSMQRPPVNALNCELISELLTTFMDLEKSKSRGVILTSASKSIFSAGLDISEFYKPDQDRLKKLWTTLQDMWLQLFSSSFPTVAFINGHSPAGGCLLAGSCEYRVMLQGNYTIGLNETQLGIVAPTWFIDTFRFLVSPRITEMALLEGKLFPVDEALKIGLIDEIAKDEEDAMQKAENYLMRFKKISYFARAQTKIKLRYEAIKRLQETREEDLRIFLRVINLPEIQKGLELYMQQLRAKQSKS